MAERPAERSDLVGGLTRWRDAAIRPDAPRSLDDLLRRSHGTTLTLSSQATALFKVVEPIALTAVLVALLAYAVYPQTGLGGLFWYQVAVAVVFELVVWREALALRTVRLDRSTMYVVGGRKEVAVPLAQVARVRYRRWNPRPTVWVEFRTPVDGRERIAFVARGDLAAGVPSRDVGRLLQRYIGL